jgi:hypothetical protein
MKRLTLLALLLLQGPEQLRLQTGVIQGEIRGVDGRPAAGVRVSAVPDRPASGAAVLDTMSVLAETDASGRYSLESIPPGRYRIAAGLIDSLSYYPGVSSLESARSVVVSAGATVTAIDFTLARSAGVRVAGSIKGFPVGAARGLLRVTLMEVRTAVGQPAFRPSDALVGSDGKFEFLKVTPGTYDVRMNPSLPSIPLTRIQVENSEMDSLSISPGSGILIAGTMTVSDGTPLPTRRGIAGLIDIPTPVRLGTAPVVANSLGSGIVSPVRAADGAFVAVLPEGEYRIGAMQLPMGYSIQSISLGSIDLLQSPLKVTGELAGRSEQIRVTLTTVPLRSEPAWRKVSGRVFGMSAEQAAQSFVAIETPPVIVPTLASLSGTPQRSGEASVRTDGTFEIANVPPGAYSLRVLDPVGRGMPGAAIGLTVADFDISGVELIAPAPSPPTNTAAPPLPVTNLLLQPGTLPSSQPAGVSVSGSVTLATINERSLMPHTVVLFGSAARSFQTPIATSGTFEFPNVPPGEYDLRILPLTVPNESTQVLVQMQAVTGLRVTLPPHSNLHGRVRMEDGKNLPDLSGARLKLASSLVEIEIPLAADGAFAGRLVHGEYKMSAENIPPGYTLTSNTLTIKAPGTAEIAIGLRGVMP